MAHKDNKNSKANKKASKKTKAELSKMNEETSNEIGFSNESRKLGNDGNRKRKINDPRS